MPSDYLQTTVVVAQTNAHGIFELKRQEQLQTSCFLLGENNRWKRMQTMGSKKKSVQA